MMFDLIVVKQNSIETIKWDADVIVIDENKDPAYPSYVSKVRQIYANGENKFIAFHCELDHILGAYIEEVDRNHNRMVDGNNRLTRKVSSMTLIAHQMLKVLDIGQ